MHHIKNVCDKANKKISALYRIRRFISLEQAQRLCDAYVMSHFRYCSHLWMFCNKTMGQLVDRTHKRCLRAVSGFSNKYFDDMLEEQNLPSILRMHINSLLLEVFKSQNSLSPDFMQDLFSIKILPYRLRSSNLITLPHKLRTVTFGTNALHCRCALLWNSLPDSIKCTDSTGQFKALLSSYDVYCTCTLCRF